MNRTRLDAAFSTLAAAQTAYDVAMRRVAGATTAAEASAATKALDAARVQVNAARTEIDLTRFQELATLQSSDALLGSIAGDQVLALFPVGVEAKLDPGRLRIRVWPDAISTSTHDPRLTPEELEATQQYWRAEAVATDDAGSREAWRILAERLGVTRAAWTAQVLTPTNRAAMNRDVAPVFPVVAMQDDNAPFVPRASVLPDRWIAIGIRDGARVVQAVGAPIPLDLAVGLDTTPSETAALANREGEPIQLPPRMRWMTDFTIAVQAGMALDIPVAADIDHLDDLLIIGVRLTDTPAHSADAIASLLTGHRFSRGLAFVPQDTPTNNSVAGGSGLPSRAERIDTAYSVERHPRGFVAAAEANGVAAARAFGVPADVFAAVPYSGASATIAAEPAGFEPAAARAMQAALWQVTLGATIEDFLMLPEARAESAREFFSRQVRAAGPVPAIRVGRQPYGVLPVTSIDGFVATPDEGIDARLAPLLRAARTWFAMLRQGALYEGTAEEALRQLGRSTQLFAEITAQNSMAPGDNRWKSLAGSLARASRNSIQDTWRNGRIRGTVEGIPQPVSQPIVNGTTVTEIAALASALPDAILKATAPASILARIVRHAALLEWSRFARHVCEATIAPATLDNLRTQAMLGGSEVYINVVVQAMSGRLPIDVGPIDPGRVITRASAISPTRPPGRAPVDPLRPPGPLDPPDPLPPRPPPPPPPPPVGGTVTAAERQSIRTLVGTLQQPLASSPGAARLASFRQALTDLAQFPAAQLEAEMFRTLDVCNHRVDAWFTAFASRRLATLRASQPLGVVIGGWGCLLDVRRSDAASPQQRAEFIHTPSLDHAAAAAVLRSAGRQALEGGSHHADIDLSSKRVRLARWVLEGVRNGRSLSDLLGARFERALKGTPAESQLPALRAQFAMTGSRSVLDGLRLHTQRTANTDPDVTRALSIVDDTIDAVADALTAESVYQIVRGNPIGALTDLDAIAAGAPPPALRVTETPRSGIRLTHRIALALPDGAAAVGWPSRVSPRSRAEPLLDVWCGLVLGGADATVLTVDGSGGAALDVPLSTLSIAAIDVVLAGRNDAGELAERVAAAAGQHAGLAGASVRRNAAWTSLIGLCDAAARVMTRGEVLRPDVFEPPTALPSASAEAFGDLPQRVAAAATELQSARQALIARQGTDGAIRTAVLFGIRAPGVSPGGAPATGTEEAVLAAIDARLEGAATGNARDQLRALFGGDLPGVVTFAPTDPAALPTLASPAPASLLATDPLAPGAWLDAVGRVHPRAATLAEVLLRKEITTGGPSAPLRIAQVPWKDGDRWIATAFTTASDQPATGRLSVLIHAPAGLAPAATMGGLLVDAWTDTIPDPVSDTAMALRFNNASTRAPQTILLAVNPNPAQAWTTDVLVDVLLQTLTLAQLRMQPATTVSRGGLMPLVWLGQRPGSTGLSFAI